MTIIRIFCLSKNARKCPTSDNFLQNSSKIALIWTHKNQWHLICWIAFSTALCYIDEWQPIKCCWALSAVNYPIYAIPSPRHWQLPPVSVSTCCCAAMLCSSSCRSYIENRLNMASMHPWHISWNSATIQHHIHPCWCCCSSIQLNRHYYRHYPILALMVKT